MDPKPDPQTANPEYWKRCNSCKKPIPYKAVYWVCNVSTCNRKRLGLSFCTVSCWDAHLPLMNHRESWAEERKAPTLDEWKAELIAEAQPKKRERKPKEEEIPVAVQKPVSEPKVILRRKGGP